MRIQSNDRLKMQEISKRQHLTKLKGMRKDDQCVNERKSPEKNEEKPLNLGVVTPG